jgi:hypothetical protein
VLVVVSVVVPFVWGAGAHALSGPMQIPLFGAPFAVVGLLITIRRPEHRIGWAFAGAGLLSAVQSASVAYADAAFRTGGPHLPLAAYVGNLTQWIFAPAVLLGYTLPFLWFPEGRLLSPRWRWAVGTAVAATTIASIANLIDADPLNNYPHVRNPLGVNFAAFGAISAFAILVYVLSLFAAIASSFIRFRRSRGLERLQMRWFMVGVAGTGVAFALQVTLVIVAGDVGPAVLLMMIMPVCAAISILRYRLFDIDRVISRTVTYALVTALLVVPYVVLALFAGRLGHGSSVTVAALTLTMLALLRPVRRRVQARVDKRWNRGRYDAARIIDAFAVRLRDEVDPDVVTDGLLSVAASAMEPSTMSLWVVS